METLRFLLSDTSKKGLQTLFQTVANDLMCNHVIQKGERQYEIVEIEFYYYSPEHRDVITYPRDMQSGRWFFHPSGVDITFASQGVEQLQNGEFRFENAHFGGVLIRGLRRRSDGKYIYIFGPLKCTYELWDHFDAFGLLSANEYPILKEHQGVVTPNLRACKRCINIKKEKQKAKVAEWAGRIGLDWKQADIENYAKDLFVDSEKYLYRYFNLPNYESEMLNRIPSNARPKDIN